MNFFDALKTSASGMSAQRIRMNVISSNLANINTTRTPEGGPYQRKDVVFAAGGPDHAFRDMLEARLAGGSTPVEVVGIVNDTKPPLLKYDPQHPDADEKGYVSLPNIDLMEEMVNLLSATRSYEANVTAIKASKSMVQKALEIGK
ncbi:MAG: flagellar basal body rod protein FlgC [Desulfobacterales bacterium]|nr:flagellar basal body rod protein FlgC [Desulfobacterales bacterium]